MAGTQHKNPVKESLKKAFSGIFGKSPEQREAQSHDQISRLALLGGNSHRHRNDSAEGTSLLGSSPNSTVSEGKTPLLDETETSIGESQASEPSAQFDLSLETQSSSEESVEKPKQAEVDLETRSQALYTQVSAIRFQPSGNRNFSRKPTPEERPLFKAAREEALRKVNELLDSATPEEIDLVHDKVLEELTSPPNEGRRQNHEMNNEALKTLPPTDNQPLTDGQRWIREMDKDFEEMFKGLDSLSDQIGDRRKNLTLRNAVSNLNDPRVTESVRNNNDGKENRFQETLKPDVTLRRSQSNSSLAI